MLSMCRTSGEVYTLPLFDVRANEVEAFLGELQTFHAAFRGGPGLHNQTPAPCPGHRVDRPSMDATCNAPGPRTAVATVPDTVCQERG
jgi:hypothetical protein